MTVDADAVQLCLVLDDAIVHCELRHIPLGSVTAKNLSLCAEATPYLAF